MRYGFYLPTHPGSGGRKWNPHIAGIDAEIERLKAMGGDAPADPLGCNQRIS